MYFVNYVVIFTSFVLGGSMITLSVISMMFMAHQLSLDDQEFLNVQGFYMSLFMLSIIPGYILITTALIYSNVEAKKKLILIPFFGGLIPILVCMPFSMVIDSFKEARPLKLYI